MNAISIVPATAVAYTLAAVGTLALVKAVWKRAPKGDETLLLMGALAFLAIQYGAMGVDAFERTAGEGMGSATVWTAAAQLTVLLFWSCLCLSLRSAVRRLIAPDPIPREVDRWVLIMLGVGSAVGLAWFGYLLGEKLAGTNERLRDHLDGMSRLVVVMFPGMLGIPGWLFRILYERLPAEEQKGWIDSFRLANPTSLNLERYREPNAGGPRLNRTDYMRLFAGVHIPLVLVVVIIGLSRVEYRHTAAYGATMVCRLANLPALMSIVYFQARYSFYDVAVKRGLLFVVMAKVVAALVWFALPAVTGMHDETRRAAFCAGSVMVAWASADLFGRGEALLDRLIFRRPDYRMEAERLMREMGRRADPGSLEEAFTSGLARVLRAEFAECRAEADRASALAVSLGTGERPRGVLLLGERDRGQPYRSEELNFVDAVAGQYAALMESFDARQSERLAAHAEVRALRAQINPHFLFNALNTVADMARGAPEAERAILNLSRVFRYALDSTRRELVRLGEEVEAVRSYLEIEQARFEDRLRFEIAVAQAAADQLFPPMLIQPLVENAVKHGIGPKPGGGRVRVTAEISETGVRVEVADDGVGFDPARAHANVGLGNVRERVERGGGWFRIESRVGAGTTVTFELGKR
ncbi:MAG: histidine kinase [Acidobacteria bacterium]|nr:histidine kinase [Acidobacteriota bacterium]